MFSNHRISLTKVYDLAEGDAQLSPHFKLSEFRCKDRVVPNHIILIHPALVDLLEAIRYESGKKFGNCTIQINSAYRTEYYNKKGVQGATRSKHTMGMAADIVVRHNGRQIPPNEIASIAEALGVGGVGRYNTFTHVDVAGHDRRWRG